MGRSPSDIDHASRSYASLQNIPLQNLTLAPKFIGFKRRWMLRGLQHQRLDHVSELQQKSIEHFNALGSTDFVFLLSTVLFALIKIFRNCYYLINI